MSDHDPVERQPAEASDPARTALKLASQQHGALTREQARAVGVTEARYRKLREAALLRPVRGALLLPGGGGDTFVGQVRAAVLAAHGTTACGITAARLLGLPALPRWHPDEPVHLLLPRAGGRRQRRGAVLHFSDLDPADRVDVHGIALTGLLRTLTDLLLWHDRTTSVCVLDALLHSHQIGADELALINDVSRRRRGGNVCRTRLALADGRSESPLETRLRLVLHDAGIPPETLQHEVVDEASGRVLARLDLAWPSKGLDVEADGVTVHGEGPALLQDRWRQNALVALRWTVVRFTWRDVVGQPAYVVDTVAEHLNRRTSLRA